jgi:hypothetical protein
VISELASQKSYRATSEARKQQMSARSFDGIPQTARTQFVSAPDQTAATPADRLSPWQLKPPNEQR